MFNSGIVVGNILGAVRCLKCEKNERQQAAQTGRCNM
jgi:hypothetical protein